VNGPNGGVSDTLDEAKAAFRLSLMPIARPPFKTASR
jgi:hypothetical protein